MDLSTKNILEIHLIKRLIKRYNLKIVGRLIIRRDSEKN